MPIAVFVDIGEQVLAGQVLHLAHHARKASIGQGHLAQFPTLALVAQAQRLAGEFRMPFAQGRRAKALVGPGVPLVPNSHCAKIEQPDNAGDRSFTRQFATAQVFLDTLAHQWQQAPEGDTAVELFAFARGAEIGMIAILLAPLRIDPGREDVPVGRGAEPRVGVSGRQRDRIEAPLFLRVGDQRAFGIVIGPSPACPLAGDTGQVVVDIDELGHGEGKNLGRAVTVPHLATNGGVN